MDGTGIASELQDVAARNDRIFEIGASLDYDTRKSMDADGSWRQGLAAQRDWSGAD